MRWGTCSQSADPFIGFNSLSFLSRKHPMVKKIQKSGSTKSSTHTASPLSDAIKDSAQQIWLAGLGAFSKAQAEGGKAFDTLVKEGLSIQRKTQAVAEERISEASERVSGMATDISSKAVGQWDKLENIFEDRVAKALNKLGVPSARDVEALLDRIDGLSRQVQALGGEQAVPRKTATRKLVARKPAANKVAAEETTAPAPAKPTRKTAVRKTAASKPVAEESATAAPAKAPRKTAVRKNAKAA
ncbi:MAG: poly(hydroxyalkanoate) granule-associated protein [Hydrogenophaga sp.]|jgi:poly(hydroxyalkanoate) granule-associated protein